MQQKNKKDQMAYKEVFARNHKLLATIKEQQEETISCKFSTLDPYVPRGASIVISFSTEGMPNHVVMNDETLGPWHTPILRKHCMLDSWSSLA